MSSLRFSARLPDGRYRSKQLLHVTLTQLCDQQVRHFLDTHPDGWIINVGAGLDTRFYRVDNGRCHWIEWDITENLLWREKLFHRSERYQLVCGDVMQPQGLAELPISEFAPVLLVCEHALLDCDAQQVARFVRSIGLHFAKASACLVVAGDKTSSYLGQKLGCEAYATGLPAQVMPSSIACRGRNRYAHFPHWIAIVIAGNFGNARLHAPAFTKHA